MLFSTNQCILKLLSTDLVENATCALHHFEIHRAPSNKHRRAPATMSSPLQHHLPHINAALFVVQLLVDANRNAFGARDAHPATPDVPIAPAPFAFLIWLAVYAFAASTVAVDAFLPQYSFFNYTAHSALYRRYFSLACVTNMGFVVFDNWLGATHLATLDVFLLWGSLLPIYLVLVRHPAKHPLRPWVHFFASEFSIRLYFGWVSAAALLMVAVSLQQMHGAYLGFSVYAFLLALLLTLGISAFVYGGEPVVGLVVSWALLGLAVRDGEFPGSTQRDFEKLQAAAALAAPVIPTIIFIDAARKAYVYWKRCVPLLRSPCCCVCTDRNGCCLMTPSSRKASDVELIKAFQTSADYGTV